ncbi:hypothetical protein HJG60_011015 [Phyllostomus discolor]|uniref:Uncharacterized protein n=1 Tax=Phyllostomus discolor TaxID=89673 RepID=A0A834ACE4_9CHIR|nr:hypothetical protein HJG60_011015 [Phyllostomus discolor]
MPRTQLWFSKRNFGVAPIPRERRVGGFGGQATSNCFVSRKLGASPVGVGASWGGGKQQNPQDTQPNLLLPRGLANILPIGVGFQQPSLPRLGAPPHLAHLPQGSALVCRFFFLGLRALLSCGTGLGAGHTSCSADVPPSQEMERRGSGFTLS